VVVKTKKVHNPAEFEAEINVVIPGHVSNTYELVADGGPWPANLQPVISPMLKFAS